MEKNKSNKKAIIVVVILLIIFIIAGIISYSNRDQSLEIAVDAQGGEYEELLKIKKGQTIGSLDDPVRKGYDFLYWKVNGKKVDDDYKIEKDIKLTAVWKKKDNEDIEECIVKFDSDGGSSVASQKVEKGKKIKKPTPPTKTGYLFKEWALDGMTYDFDKTVEEDITLKAVWEETKQEEKQQEQPKNNENSNQQPKEEKQNKQDNQSASIIVSYTVSFDSAGGSGVVSQTIEENKTVEKPQDPTREGYTFSGWTLNGSAYDFNTKVTSDITLTATWQSNRNFTIGIAAVDPYSPDRYLTVYQNGTAISFKKLMYNDGTEVLGSISGTRMTVSNSDIAGETTFKVQLSTGEVITAKVN